MFRIRPWIGEISQNTSIVYTRLFGTQEYMDNFADSDLKNLVIFANLRMCDIGESFYGFRVFCDLGKLINVNLSNWWILVVFCLFKWILWISCFSEFVIFCDFGEFVICNFFLWFWYLQFFTILVNFANFVIIMIFFLWIYEFRVFVNDLLEFLEFCIYINISFWRDFSQNFQIPKENAISRQFTVT